MEFNCAHWRVCMYDRLLSLWMCVCSLSTVLWWYSHRIDCSLFEIRTIHIFLFSAFLCKHMCASMWNTTSFAQSILLIVKYVLPLIFPLWKIFASVVGSRVLSRFQFISICLSCCVRVVVCLLFRIDCHQLCHLCHYVQWWWHFDSAINRQNRLHLFSPSAANAVWKWWISLRILYWIQTHKRACVCVC